MYIGNQLTPKLLSFHAVRPWIWKSGLIKCFFNRDFIVCINWFAFHEEISTLKDVFHMNGYPQKIIDNHLKKFLSEKLMTTYSCLNTNDEKKYSFHTILWLSFSNFQKVINYMLEKSLTNFLKSINKNAIRYLKHLQFKNNFL